MQTLKVKYRKIEDLIPYAKNARTHSDRQIDEIANRMLAVGWTNPVLTGQHSEVIAGHGRLRAAKKLWDSGKEIKNCPTGSVPTIELNGLRDDEIKAYIIADNKLALNAGWDIDLLTGELNELLANGGNLSETGFDEKELEHLLKNLPATDDFDSEEKTVPADRQINSFDGVTVKLKFSREMFGKYQKAIDAIKQKKKIESDEDAVIELLSSNGR